MRGHLFFIAMMFPVMLQAQKNSQWRGDNRDGIYHETGLLKSWPADGPRMLWAFDGLGEGFTSAAIANEKIYITGLIGDKLMLFVLDLNGKALNKKEVGREQTDKYPGTRSTVCVNDGKLYIYNALGHLFCLDEETLNVVWQKDLFRDFDGKNIYWGVAESPLIMGEKLFMTPGGKKYNMVALNKNTGALIWSSPGLGTLSAYCSPQYIADQSIPIVVTATNYDIVAFNADTGEKLWSHPQTNNSTGIHPNTPIYHNGMIFSSTGYKGGAILLRLKNSGKSVELAWKNNEMDNQVGGAMKVGNYVYASGHENRYWFCLDWNTGKTMYKVNRLAQCNVIFADGMLYCYTERGEMALVKPNPEKFELVSSFKITLGTGQHWAHPVIHRGVMYVRHGNTLMAFKVK